MTKTEEFLELYKDVESWVRIEYKIPNNESAFYYLIKNIARSQREKNNLNYCRDVRNFLVHNPKVKNERDIESDFAVMPSDKMVDLLKRTFESLKNPVRVMDICIKVTNIKTATIEDTLEDIMKSMRENTFTHIPILDKGVVKGVFSETTLFDYLLDNQIMGTDVKLEVFEDYLPLEKHSIEVFKFLPKKSLIYDSEKLFLEAFERNERIGILFITENGKKEEKILGMLTPWDVIGR